MSERNERTTGAADPTLARRILEAVAAAGVDTVFGLPGVHNLAFWRESGPGLPRVIGVRHEQTTVYAADGLARASGGLGVAITTTGPGAANALAAFGEAAAAASPVLLVATEISTALARPGVIRGVLHESADQAALFAPLAKAVYRPRTAEAAVDQFASAIRTAMTCPRGPVYLDIPTDLLTRPAPACTLRAVTTIAPVSADVDRLIAELEAAESIVIWAGGGVLQADATAELGRLAERLAAPIVTSWTARGVLAPGHPWLVGFPPHEPAVAALVAGADLLLAVGTGFDGTTTRNWTMPVPERLACVNVDATEMTKNYRPDTMVLGDAKLVLAAAADRVPARSTANPVIDVRVAVQARLAGDPAGPDPLRMLRSIEAAIAGTGPTVIADMAVPGYWWVGYGAVAGPRRLQYPLGWGTLGYALPASVGAATARPVLVICGDGGLLMGVGELATLAQEQLPVTVLVVDDGGYGMLRYDQDRLGDPHRGVDLRSPEWTHLGAAFGIPTQLIDDVGEPLERALGHAMAAGGPQLVVVPARLIPPRTTSPRWAD
ncbi:MAG: thiamine pyrophosphate-binding protein [Geodermatophilaceae bacterium]|nr:thiamine pyrophosphate-binding protein [Geodermatophilaceae bacterium]